MRTEASDIPPVKPNGAHRPGPGTGNYKRTPEMLARAAAKARRTRRRNAREAVRAANGRKRGGRKGAKSAPSRGPSKARSAAYRENRIDARTYLEHAARRALALAAGGVPEGAAILGLIELAREALGGE